MTLRVVQLDTVGSTNDYALGLISDIQKQRTTVGPVEWTDIAVLANTQTAGRGRMNSRTWVSTRGNFHCSYIVDLDRLGIHEHDTACLNPVILRSITTLLQRLGGETDAIHIKVPNDIMIHGKKVAGVLVETSHPYAVIGIGINTIAAPIPISTSLLDALGIHVNNADMAAQLHTIIIAELT